MCGLYDLKPAVFAERRPENNLVRFAKDFGDGETNIYSGFDVNMESRFANGAFARFGLTAGRRTFDDCSSTSSPATRRPSRTRTARPTATASTATGPT